MEEKKEKKVRFGDYNIHFNIDYFRKKGFKLVEIIILILFISWSLLLIIDYIRSINDLKPLIVLSHNKLMDDDMEINEYSSFGYTYRTYEERDFFDSDLKPFWSEYTKMQVDFVYPKLNENYEIPENIDKLDKVDDILYFYEEDELIYTYQCFDINCVKASDFESNEVLSIYKDFVFIKDVEGIYIIDYIKGEIIYKVNELIAPNLFVKTDAFLGEYIFIDENNNYGVLKLTDDLEIIAAPTYELIKFNPESLTYTVKNDYYHITDFDKNYYTSEEEILEAFVIDDKFYFMSLKNVVNGINYYNLHDEENTLIFTKDYKSIDYLNDLFFVVDSNNQLQVIDINNETYLKNSITLYLDVNPYSVTIDEEYTYIKVNIDNSRSITYKYRSSDYVMF